MISHQHKCIFIHISKCAGSSIEAAFGIDLTNISESNNENLFGWNSSSNMFLQHATPQQLIDNAFLNEDVWNSYFKFIIVRNPWDRSLSDYKWFMKEINKRDSFYNFLNKKGKFHKQLTDRTSIKYRGDHLYKQIEYFFLNNKPIEYNRVLRFENLDKELLLLEKDLNLEKGFFNKKYNVNNEEKKHYSKFYNTRRKQMVDKFYEEDIKYLNYTFNDKKNIFDYLNFYKRTQDLV